MRRAYRNGGIAAGIVVLLVILVILLWDWNWFRPLVEARAGAAIGRKVSIGRLHVALGRVTQVGLDDVKVANPDGFPADEQFADIAHLTVRFGLFEYLFHSRTVLELIDVDQPRVIARQLASGANNWTLKTAKGGSGPAPQIGDLRITDGQAHVVMTKPAADMQLTVATHDQQDTSDSQIIVGATGTYARQKITGRFVGGALLTLRDAAKPYPIDLSVVNGLTSVSLKGTVSDPMAFKGADLRLKLAGKDMEQLYPLTGIAIPSTPPYHIDGQLDYEDHKIRFRNFAGVVGSSDLEGTIAVDPRPQGPRPLLDATLQSRSVDLNDLAGFIGGTPGDKSTKGQTTQQKQQVAQASQSSRLLPETTISIPKLKAADVHLSYKGRHIQGRIMPFDDIVVKLDIVDGAIRMHPLDFAIGSGTLESNIALKQTGSVLSTDADVKFDRLDLSRIMQATHAFHGSGVIGGGATLRTTGNSLSAMLSNGDGSMRFNMAGGGDLSALLQDLSGLQFGDAVLSALGVPNKAVIKCLRTQFTLEKGVMRTDIFALDTTEAVTRGKGSLDFSTEKLDFTIQTKPTHFTVGSLHAPIDVGGTLKKPAIGPDAGALAARGAAAVGLGVLFPPLALLPTIQLGVGQNTDCEKLAKGG